MLISNMPVKFPIPFGNSASATYKRQVPTASQIGITDGAASLTDGFPPLTFTDIAAGGVPPDGRDVNGIINQATAWARWQAAGGPVSYDPAFSTAIGGYPQGAQLLSSVTPGRIWVSTANNNTTDPDGGSPANWIILLNEGFVHTTNGYDILPSGLIWNWGRGTTINNSGILVVSFAKPYVVAPPFNTHATNAASAIPQAFHGTGDATLTEMTVYCASAPGVAAPAGIVFNWSAIGR